MFTNTSTYISIIMTGYAAEQPGRGIVVCCTITGARTLRFGISIRIITEDTSLSAWADTGLLITAIPVITGMAAILIIGMATILSPAR